MNGKPYLLFVYNADSGLFNTMADIGHKIFSPETYQCSLCALTHGYFKERGEWRSFIESLDRECVFLHRDEFLRQFPDSDRELPAVFRVENNKAMSCVDREAITGCEDLAQLQSLISAGCGQLSDSGPD